MKSPDTGLRRCISPESRQPQPPSTRSREVFEFRGRHGTQPHKPLAPVLNANHRDTEERGQRKDLQNREDEAGTGRDLRLRTAISVIRISQGKRRAEMKEARTEPRERMPSAERHHHPDADRREHHRKNQRRPSGQRSRARQHPSHRTEDKHPQQESDLGFLAHDDILNNFTPPGSGRVPLAEQPLLIVMKRESGGIEVVWRHSIHFRVLPALSRVIIQRLSA